VLVYRTDKYKRLKAEVEKQSKKCKYSSGIRECVLLLLLHSALADVKLNRVCSLRNSSLLRERTFLSLDFMGG